MTMGEYIKKLRTGENVYGKKWSQEELGHSLKPPVNRCAINKWEKGRVENIKRTHIEQLAKMFGITPSELMCFDQSDEEKKISQEVKTFEAIQKLFGEDAFYLLQQYLQLNDLGKQKALEDIADLTELPKYTE